MKPYYAGAHHRPLQSARIIIVILAAVGVKEVHHLTALLGKSHTFRNNDGTTNHITVLFFYDIGSILQCRCDHMINSSSIDKANLLNSVWMHAFSRILLIVINNIDDLNWHKTTVEIKYWHLQPSFVFS